MKYGPVLRRCLLGVMVLVGLSVHTAMAKPLEVLSEVHDGADAVLVIPSLRQLSDKIVLLGNQLGLGAQVPPDPLMLVKMMGGLMQGIDDTRNVAVVVYDLEKTLQHPSPMALQQLNMVILLPVTTTDAFMANFAGMSEDAGAGVSKIMLLGKPMLASKLNDQYMMLSKTRAPLENYKSAKADQWTSAQGAVAGDYLDKGDAVLLFNPKTLAVMLNKNMPEIRQSMKASLDAGQRKNPEMAEFRPLIDYYVDLMLRGTQSLLDNTTGMAIGLTISQAGISSGMSMQFAEGSNLNQILANTPGDMGPIDRLPDLPWVSLTKFDPRNLDQKQMLELVKQCVPSNEFVPEKAKAASIAFGKIVDNWKLYNYACQQMQVANAAGTTQVLSAIECDGQSAEAFEQIRAIMKPLIELFNGIMSQAAPDKQNLISMSYDQDKMQVEGATKTDVLTVTGTGEVGQAFTQSFGDTSLKQYNSYNEAGVVSVLGDQSMLKQSLEAVAAKQEPEAISKMTAMMRPNLPANRFVESYMSLPNYLKQIQSAMLKQPNGMQVAMMIGMFQLPDTLPPIVNTVSNTAGGVRMDSLLPMQTLTAVAQKGMALSGAFMGQPGGGGEDGGNNGGGGGAPPAPF